MQRILIFGDSRGIPDLLARIDNQRIAAVVASDIRPGQHFAIKQLAKERGVSLLIQPRISDECGYRKFISVVKALEPDCVICHSYAMLVREDILSLVEGRAFNIHYALLPRHRGPNPVQWTLIHGDRCAGVTLHVMETGFDNGAIVAQKRIEVLESDTWLSLLKRLDKICDQLLDETIPDLLAGQWQETRQNENAALQNPRISKESFQINFAVMDDEQIFNLIRAQVAPLAGAYVKTPAGKVHFPDYVPMSEIASLRMKYVK